MLQSMGGKELDMTELNNKCGEKRRVHMWGEMGAWKERQCVTLCWCLCVWKFGYGY